jgi:hypothetical protein
MSHHWGFLVVLFIFLLRKIRPFFFCQYQLSTTHTHTHTHTHIQNTIHTQQQIEPPPPYPPAALPSLSMGRSAALTIHGAMAPYGSVSGARSQDF